MAQAEHSVDVERLRPADTSACEDVAVVLAHSQAHVVALRGPDELELVLSVRAPQSRMIMSAHFLCESRRLALVVGGPLDPSQQTLFFVPLEGALPIAQTQLPFAAVSAISTRDDLWVVSGSDVHRIGQVLDDEPEDVQRQKAAWKVLPAFSFSGAESRGLLHSIVRFDSRTATETERRFFPSLSYARTSAEEWLASYGSSYTFEPGTGRVRSLAHEIIQTMPFLLRVPSAQRMGNAEYLVTPSSWGEGEGKPGIDAIWRYDEQSGEWAVVSRLPFSPTTYLYEEDRLLVAGKGHLATYSSVTNTLEVAVTENKGSVPLTMARVRNGVVVAYSRELSVASGASTMKGNVALYDDALRLIGAVAISNLGSNPVLTSPMSPGAGVSSPLQ